MTKGNHRPKYTNETYLNSHLTNRAKRQLRLIHIFKNAVRIAYEDARRNPAKLVCFATFPTTTTLLTIGFITLGLTKQSRQYKTQLIDAKKGPASYKLYKDFMDVRSDQMIDIDLKALRRHLCSQGFSTMGQDLYNVTSKWKDSRVKKFTQNRLRKRMVKGELALVS